MRRRTAVVPSALHPGGGEAGFSMMEVLVSMLLMTTSLLAVGQVFLLGMTHTLASSPNLTAREKAREAIESVHTARDTRVITWSRIRNVTPRMCPGVAQPAGWNNTPGVFVDGAQPGGLHAPGDDGLVNTAGDDSRATRVDPAPRARRHRRRPPTTGSRTSPSTSARSGSAIRATHCREVRVIVRYRIGAIERTYRLTTFVSNYS